MKKVSILLLITTLLCTHAGAIRFNSGQTLSYHVDKDVAPVIHSAISLFEEDVQRGLNAKLKQTNKKRANIRIQTDSTAFTKKGNTHESFQIFVHDNQLYIQGSDANGTAYGVMELSRMLGVSPWVWWADSKPKRLDQWVIPNDIWIEQSPVVAHRGIFINDEDWGLTPWSWKNYEHSDQPGRIGPKTHERIFQLMLRLRANIFWPAMHECSIPFYLVPGNRQMADKYGITIGTSHCEPMQRNTNGEWNQAGVGAYDYINNAENVFSFWEERVKEVAQSNNYFTIGMRGVHDGKMNGAKTIPEQRRVLDRVFNDQRSLISKHVNKDITSVPQVFIPYKEVLDIYNSGLEVPDDVTLMWCDDNYGYMKHLPTEEEQQRSGGNGMYYHISYWGRPHDYLWLASTSPALMQTEFERAYRHNTQKIWVINVGDIKPGEFLTEYSMDMAWDKKVLLNRNSNDYLEYWYAREFGSDIGKRLLPLWNEYYVLNYQIRPEFLGNTRVEERDPLYSVVKDLPLTDRDIENRLRRCIDLELQIKEIALQIDAENYAHWFQLVEYPIAAFAAMNQKMLFGQLARHGKRPWSLSNQAYERIVKLTETYNAMLDGKWNGMMDYKPRRLPVFMPLDTTVKSETLPEPMGRTWILNASRGTYGVASYTIPELGYSRQALSLQQGDAFTTVLPATKDSLNVTLTFVPNHPVGAERLTVNVRVEGEPSVQLHYNTHGRSEEWKRNVLYNRALRSILLPPSSKERRIIIEAATPAVLLDELILREQFSASPRKERFNAYWKFYKGSHSNGADPKLDDIHWRVLDLPHDWSIEPLPNQEANRVVGPFSKESVGGFAVGHTLGGEAWYRKSFVVAEADQKKRHELYFEGIYNEAEIWMNGQKIGENKYGYSSFRVNITPYCLPVGHTNTLAIRVLNKGKNSRWYAGSGIYRHVWLLRTAALHLPDWGTFIQTKSANEQRANLSVQTMVVNSEVSQQTVDVHIDVLSPDGKRVAQALKSITIDAGDTTEVPFDLVISNPKRWSTEAPHLYSIQISLQATNEQVDRLTLPFGIRTLHFSSERGFELNGIPTLLKGGCLHHDHGLLGSAAFDAAEERKIRLLKENGYNAIRTAHNPMSEGFMDACDRLGMLVVNEAFDQWSKKKNDHDYHQYFDSWSTKDIRALVLRDRNRPSVIMWSIGNEIPERITEKGKDIAGNLKKEILRHDTSRPITAGINKYWDKQRINQLPLDNAFYHLDVAGYNYMWRNYVTDHQQFPKRVLFGSESVSKEAAQNWDLVEKYPYVIGDFVWTAQDYYGESGLGNSLEINPEENVHQFMGWPWFNAWCGELDILGNKKPQSYYRDILWRNRNVSMAVEKPIAEGKIRKVSFWGWRDEVLSWDFPGMENQTLTVNVYTRAPIVQLYLNNVLIGEKQTNNHYTASFQVKYTPGILKAVIPSTEASTASDSVSLKTSGPAAHLRITANKTKMRSDGQDLVFALIELVDKDGNLIYDSERTIRITGNGNGADIIGTGNASPTDMESFHSLTPKLYNGRAMVILRPKSSVGRFEVSVHSLGLPDTVIGFDIYR